MSGAVLARIPGERYSDYRYEAIFRAYKWDPQVEDHNTVAEHVVLLDRQTARQLEQWAEQLSAETMEIEQAMMDTLIGFGIPARLHDNAPGVYVPSEGGAGEFQGIAKIGALGLKVSRGCSYHGCSLNVSMDLSPFSRINPCGYPGLRTTDMAHAGFRGSYAEAEESLIQHLIKNIEND